MPARRSALGRGLGALIPGAEAVASREAPAGGGPVEVPIGRIDPNPDQPRRRFDTGELGQLAASIRRHGVLQPVVVRRAGERFELVVGERRWRAAEQAGLASIPAVVADVAPRARLELALVENVQRNDLNPIELALAFRALAAEGATQEKIGERVGLERSTVANHLRLLDLSRDLQSDVEEGRLGIGHAKALLQVGNAERRRGLRDRIVRDGLSVRQAEAAARSTVGPNRGVRGGPRSGLLDPDLTRLLDALRVRLKTRVRLVGTPARGRLEIEFFGPEELNRIADALLGVP